MKKNFLKFMTAGLAITALASCADDLREAGISGFDSDADLTAQLADVKFGTRTGVFEQGGDPNKAAIVFTEGDKIRVFTADAMAFNQYELTSGAGSTEAQFKLTTKQALPNLSEKYAITEAAMVYGVTPNEQGVGVLTMTVPKEFTPTYKNNIAQFPAPFWGVCEESGSGDNIKLKARLSGLTAFLRVDINELPAGTKKIVLTTHGGQSMIHDDAAHFDQQNASIDAHQEGFELAATMPANDTNQGWNEADNVNWITGGASEALSGTFNTELVSKKDADGNTVSDKKKTYLKVDERLVHSDVLTVDLSKLPEGSNIFYVPIIPNTYQDLFVIAVSGESKYSYRWAGQIVKEYKNYEFAAGKFYSLQMNVIDLGEVDQNTLNEQIALFNTQAGRLSVFNVEKLVDTDANEDKPSYSTNSIDVVGAGNVELNLAAIDLTNKLTNGKILVTDKGAAANSSVATSATMMGKKIYHTAYVNVPKEYGTSGDAKEFMLNFPTMNVEFGTVDNVNGSATVTINGAATKFSSGLDVVNGAGEVINKTDAAVIIRNGAKKVTVNANTKGDVRVYNGSEDNQTEISVALNILPTKDNTIRIDDALVNTLAFKEKADNVKEEHYVVTTGSAALKAVIAYMNGDAWDATTKFTTSYGNKIPGALPNNAKLMSFYTGAGLTNYAWSAGYDCGTVYTVAQLQSLGEKERSTTTYSYNGYTEQITSTVASVNGRVAPAKYVIPRDLVTHMWLGGEKYPWLGANVTDNGFTLDGERTSLQNLTMDLRGQAGTQFYLADPHMCCTSCGTPALGPKTADIAITENIGLIRSIINSDNATVTNVNLNDVKFIAPESTVPNVGAIVGKIKSSGTVTLTNNYVGEPQIEMGGANVGGMVGNIVAAEQGTLALVATDNQVKGQRSHLTNTVKGGSYVGGLIGNVKVTSAKLNNDKVTLAGEITANTSYAAGLVASVLVNSAVDPAIELDTDEVTALKIKAIGGQYAAGLVGYLQNKSTQASENNGRARLVNAKVTVSETISAAKEFAGGLVAQSNMGAAKFDMGSLNVKVNTISAIEGLAGGVLGQSVKGAVTIGAGLNQIVNIDVEKLDGAYAVAGVVGENRSNTSIGSTSTTSSFTIDITAFSNAGKKASFYTEDNAYMAGTISNVIGQTSADVEINENQLNVTEHMTPAMKIALMYPLHYDQIHTKESVGQSKYWGDYNGYVGWNGTGSYKINGVVVNGDAEATGCNLFKTESEYQAMSKLATE